MDDVKKLKTIVEYQYLKHVVEGVRNKTLSLPDAKKSAQAFLKLLPFASTDDIKNKMETYANEFSQFSFLAQYIKVYEEEQKMASVIEKMKQHIQNNNIDEALKVANVQ